MKKVFKVEGADCAHCALTLEDVVKSVPGVASCSVSFITGKMRLEFEDESVLSEIKKTVAKKAPSFEVVGL